MDTKLTGSKKFSYMIAAALVIAATAGYLMLYPVFKDRAAAFDVDVLGSLEFLNQLYWGSCTLYKDVMEAVTGESVEYVDLYLDVEDVSATEFTEEELDGIAEELSETWDETYARAGSWKQMARERLSAILQNWREEMLNGLAREMDYCIIDRNTGKSIKNTGREIEKLAQKNTENGGSRDNVQDPKDIYTWYVLVSFDSVGNPEQVAVKGKDADELLKDVQAVMKGNQLWSLFWSGLNYDASYADGSIYYHDEYGNIRRTRITVSSTPKDVTCIFALTKEQQDKLLNESAASNVVSSRTFEEWHAYIQAGTPNILRMFFLVLALSALALTRVKRYCLHELAGVRLHIEISIPAILIMLSSGAEAIASLVNYTNRGYFDRTYQDYLPGLPESLYPVVTELVNILILLFLFTLWYYLITSFGELFHLGVRGFLRERSLLYKCVRLFTGSCKRNVLRLREEILHADLGEKEDKTILKLVLVNFFLLAAVSLIWVFGWAVLIFYSIALYFGLKKYVQKIKEQYRRLFDATRSIADGNLQTEMNEDWGIFESYKTELARIQDGFKAAVDEEVKSQRMKTELITNVSHDLKTPLTAITTYIELLEQEDITQEQREEYLEVLKRKAHRLKFLIEDLFEISKASTGNITLNPVDVDICSLMRQVYLEYEDQAEAAELIFRFCLPEEKVVLKLDSQKTYRVFENLYINIVKYAMPGTRVYVNAERTDKGVEIELKNMSATELNIAPAELTERFVRGDSSRNTEGSGLGLAIASSFVELQGGSLEVEIDGDLFKVKIFFKYF